MAVDKNLFLYDLAVVAIMKNEAPYVKEWLDYHLLAGVDHFYIYDNESPDGLREVLQPYIDAGIVTYKFYPGKARQYEAYNEAVQNFKFYCRYMAFIDTDEFIFPQNNRSIVEVVDEILAGKANAAALVVNWHLYGWNFQEKADLSRGVMERLTRRAKTEYADVMPNSGLYGGNAHVKTIADPRKIKFLCNPHYAIYFEGFGAVNSNGEPVPLFSSYPPRADKIIVNHYSVKSREEYAQKIGRGTADSKRTTYTMQGFERNGLEDEIFDDSILTYRAARIKITGGVAGLPDYHRISNALVQNIFPTLVRTAPPKFFAGKLETYLTCRALAVHLREKLFDETAGRFFEEAALNAVYKTLFTQVTIQEVRLLLSEMPKILALDYPAVKNICSACLQLIPQIMDIFRVYDPNAWREFVNLEYVRTLLETFDAEK